MSDSGETSPADEQRQYKRSRKRSQPSPDADTMERPQKFTKYDESSKEGEESLSEGPGGEILVVQPRSAKLAARKALIHQDNDSNIRKRTPKRRLSTPGEVVADYVAEMKKQFEEVDSFVMEEERYHPPPKPSYNSFEFIELIDPDRAERIKRRREEAMKRGTEVLRKHHDIGKPAEEIAADTVREVTDEVRRVFEESEIESPPKQDNPVQENDTAPIPTKDDRKKDNLEKEHATFEVTPFPSDTAALSANVNLKGTPSSPTTRSAKKRSKGRSGSTSA